MSGAGWRVQARKMAKMGSRLYTVPSAGLRALPDFLIIGAQRAGTTSLYRYLAEHPAVIPAVLNKGIHYFDTDYGRGDSWYRSHFPSEPYKAVVRRRTGQARVVTGEGSPYYSFHPLCPERIARTLPEARFIIMLRDPVGRAHSQYEHERARGFESLTFEAALREEEARLAGEEDRMRAEPLYVSFEHQHHSYVARGRYVDQLRRWHDHVDPDRLLVIDAGAFFADPDAEYRTVLRFLELPERSLSEYGQLNAHSYHVMSEEARAFLASRFDAADRELAELLGRELSWTEARST